MTPETTAELRRLLDELPDDVRDAFTQVGELDFTEAPPAAELWAKSLAALPALLDAAAERDALAAKVERVRALHPRDDDMCCNCGQPHPCDTRAALDEEAQP